MSTAERDGMPELAGNVVKLPRRADFELPSQTSAEMLCESAPVGKSRLAVMLAPFMLLAVLLPMIFFVLTSFFVTWLIALVLLIGGTICADLTSRFARWTRAPLRPA